MLRKLLTTHSADLPALTDVRGAFTLISSENIDDACTTFMGLKDDGTIKGTYTCRGEESDPENSDQPEGNSNGSGGSSSGGNGNSTNASAASSIQITGATSFLCVVAIMFGLL